MSVQVMQPAACPTCRGDGVVGHTTMSWCPECRCVQCGQSTSTAPICGDCVRGAEEAAGQR